MNRVFQAGPPGNSSLADVTLPLEIRLGRRDVTMAEVRAIQSGVVLPLDKLIGDPLELFVGNVRLASVELVVKDGWLSARVVDIRQNLQPEADGGSEGPEPGDE
jgi:flagellar motor switch protein FliN